MNPEKARNNLTKTIEAREERRQAAARSAATHEHEKRVKRERARPFDALEERNAAVLKRVVEFLGNASGVTKHEEGTVKIDQAIVVVERSPVTALTPDHTLVCDVRYRRKGYFGSKPLGEQVEFHYGHVASDRIPLLLRRAELNRLGAASAVGVSEEESYSTQANNTHDVITAIAASAEHVNYVHTSRAKRKAFRETYEEISAGVRTIEQSADWVLAAAANPELNPHLHQADSRPVIRQ